MSVNILTWGVKKFVFDQVNTIKTNWLAANLGAISEGILAGFKSSGQNITKLP